jgi:predicted DCC family thiol-disulfide oxidoreductase YuxK
MTGRPELTIWPDERNMLLVRSVLVLYDGDCGICERSATWLTHLDARRRLEIRPLQSAAALVTDAPAVDVMREAIHVRLADGTWRRGGDAVLAALEELPGWRVAARLVRRTPLNRLVEPVYDLVARNRWTISRRLGLEACATEAPATPARAAGSSGRSRSGWGR